MEMHNGWTNKPTWIVSIWISNDKEQYKYWSFAAQEALMNADNSEWVSIETIAEANLADRLKCEIEARAPKMKSGVYKDALNWALARVDWDGVARHLIAIAKEG